MKVALLFEWEDLRGVYRSPELARRAAQRSRPRKPLKWTAMDAGGAQYCYTNSGATHFEIDEEEVLEA